MSKSRHLRCEVSWIVYLSCSCLFGENPRSIKRASILDHQLNKLKLWEYHGWGIWTVFLSSGYHQNFLLLAHCKGSPPVTGESPHITPMKQKEFYAMASSCIFSRPISRDKTLSHRLNSLWPSDAIWRQRIGSRWRRQWLVAWPGHYPNKYWLIISKVQWH